MRTVDQAVEAIEAGSSWDDSDEVVELQVRQPMEKVIPIRLSAETWAAIRRIAQSRGLGPSTLARMWIIERLGEELPAAFNEAAGMSRAGRSPSSKAGHRPSRKKSP
jgi:hypothetical protein